MFSKKDSRLNLAGACGEGRVAHVINEGMAESPPGGMRPAPYLPQEATVALHAWRSPAGPKMLKI